MTNQNKISAVITVRVWEFDQMAFSTSSVRTWHGDKGNLKAWNPVKTNGPKPRLLGSQDWFVKN